MSCTRKNFVYIDVFYLAWHGQLGLVGTSAPSHVSSCCTSVPVQSVPGSPLCAPFVLVCDLHPFHAPLPPSFTLAMSPHPTSPPGISIRPAAPGDHAAIAALTDVMGMPVGLPPPAEWEARIMPDTFVAEDVASSSTSLTGNAASGDSSDTDPSVVTSGPPAIVGYIWAQSCALHGYVRQLAVAPTRRRCGFGRALLTAVTTSWARAGCVSWHLYVGEANTAATRLYRSAGGAPTASLTAVFLPWSAVAGLGVRPAGDAGGLSEGGTREVLVAVELPPELDAIAAAVFAPSLPSWRLGCIRRGGVAVLATISVPVEGSHGDDEAGAMEVAAAAASDLVADAAAGESGVGGRPPLAVRGVCTYDPALGGTAVFAASGESAAGVMLRALALRAAVAQELPGGLVVGVDQDELLVDVLLAAGAEVVHRAQLWTGVVQSGGYSAGGRSQGLSSAVL